MKRFLSVFIAMILILMQIPSISIANSQINNPPSNTDSSSYYKPSLVIEDGLIPEVNAGTSIAVEFELKNTGYTATDIVVTPVFGNDSPFTSNNLTNSIPMGSISKGSQKTVKLEMEVSPTAMPGSYPIPVKINYNYVSYATDPPTKYSETLEAIVYVKVSNKSTQPKLIITKNVTSPEIITPGQDVKLSVLFENKGSVDVKNVSVKLEGLDNDKGFYISSGSDIVYVKNVSGNLVSYAEFYLKSSNSIKRGAHKLNVTFSYNGVTETQAIYLNVGGDAEQNSNILIENLSYPTTAINPNKDFVLKFDLRNNGGVNANNILVKVESSDPTVIPKTNSIKKINTMAPDGKESLEFIFFPTEEAITRNYPINISVEYEDEFNQDSEVKHRVNQYVGIYVEKSGDSTKGKPKLIIDKYNFEPQLVRAGENFEMTLSFYNTNSSKTVNNIKIFLTAESGTSNEGANAGSSAFTPVDSSNTFYIDSIPPRGRVEKKITMFTIPDAIAKTHTITANFEYEDSDGNELKDIELIGVPVVQNSRLETGELSYYPEAMIGQPMPVSLEFYNTGKVTLYNMMVKLEGDFQTENGSSYIGNFVTGSSEYFEGMVMPSEPGELKGAVLFTYEDSTGQMQELRKEFTLNVMEMPPMEEFPGEMPPMEEGPTGVNGILKSKWLWISLIAILVIVGGVIFYKKKKKKKEMAFDE
ncbi:hypothetical protein [Tissierella sp.]|uniref:COG1361 S-layer family protein n=1 Tax=Tissierella sp. TaxID=41274 RepID=UPI00286761E2|nr:hypothetical protein [Tissierella sp.]MDR7856979.1 hypothetical protein [Tissierella sp.]